MILKKLNTKIVGGKERPRNQNPLPRYVFSASDLTTLTLSRAVRKGKLDPSLLLKFTYLKEKVPYINSEDYRFLEACKTFAKLLR